MKTLSKIALIFLVGIAISSCERYKYEPADVQSIFVNKCSGCHPPTVGLDFTEGNVYNTLTTHNGGSLLDLNNPENSLILVKSTDGHGSIQVTTGEENLILEWIQNGAQEF